MRTKSTAPSSAHSRAIVAWAALTVSASAIVMWPRPIAPREMPWLSIHDDAIGEVIAHERALATRAPATEAARNLTALVRAQNEAEAHGGEQPHEPAARTANLRALRGDVQRESGDDGLEAMRAVAMREMERSIREGSGGGPAAVFGSFPRVMERYGVTQGGQLRAPAFVLRTLFKSRWNTMLGLSPLWRLTGTEKQAYFGWLAIGAQAASYAERSRGLSDYMQAGGARVHEIDGVLAWEQQQYERAAESFRRALGEDSSFRVRNYEIAANAIAGR